MNFWRENMGHFLWCKFPRAGAVVWAVFAFAILAAISSLGASNVETDPTKKYNEKTDDETVSDPVSPITGGVVMEQADVFVPCPGMPLAFLRNRWAKRGSYLDI
jgi:hypothetical protein